jgi:hypothetical protein
LIIDVHGLEELPQMLAVHESGSERLCPTVSAEDQGDEKDLK